MSFFADEEVGERFWDNAGGGGVGWGCGGGGGGRNASIIVVCLVVRGL